MMANITECIKAGDEFLFLLGRAFPVEWSAILGAHDSDDGIQIQWSEGLNLCTFDLIKCPC